MTGLHFIGINWCAIPVCGAHISVGIFVEQMFKYAKIGSTNFINATKKKKKKSTCDSWCNWMHFVHVANWKPIRLDVTLLIVNLLD